MYRFLRKLFFFLLYPVIAIILIETFCNILNIPKASYSNLEAKGLTLIPKVDNSSIILVGDSRIEWGIKPEMILNPEGEVYNLAFPNSNGFDILKYLLDNRIYPKAIIMGFTPNNHRYTNHNFDTMEFSAKNRMIENVKYYLKQNSYVYDWGSILSYFYGTHPFTIDHSYDKWGGVTVTEHGDFEHRFKMTKEHHKEWEETFDSLKYQHYIIELNDLLNKFRGKSELFGLYMPASEPIMKLEGTYYNKKEIIPLFEHYLDYSKSIQANDSTYYLDGSHLSKEFAIRFSKKIDSVLKLSKTTNKPY